MYDWLCTNTYVSQEGINNDIYIKGSKMGDNIPAKGIWTDVPVPSGIKDDQLRPTVVRQPSNLCSTLFSCKKTRPLYQI